MNKKWVTLLTVFLVFVGGTLIVNYFSSDKESLCVYEIPNHIKMKCGEGNETKTVNFFQLTFFEYNNAIGNGCYMTEQLEDYGFRYEISICNESLPFRIFR